MPMKRPQTPDESARFSGHLRHYHRSGPPVQRSWDDWVEGTRSRRKGAGAKCVKVLGILLALLALGGIIAGLIIEMR